MVNPTNKKPRRSNLHIRLSALFLLVVVLTGGLWWIKAPVQPITLAIRDRGAHISSSDRVSTDQGRNSLGLSSQYSEADGCTLSALNPFGPPVSLACIQAAQAKASMASHGSFIEGKRKELETTLTDAISIIRDKRIESFGLFAHALNLCARQQPIHEEQLCAVVLSKLPTYIEYLTESFEGGNAAAAIPLLEARINSVSLYKFNSVDASPKYAQNTNTVSMTQLMSALELLAVTNDAAANLLEFIENSETLEY